MEAILNQFSDVAGSVVTIATRAVLPVLNILASAALQVGSFIVDHMGFLGGLAGSLYGLILILRAILFR